MAEGEGGRAAGRNGGGAGGGVGEGAGVDLLFEFFEGWAEGGAFLDKGRRRGGDEGKVTVWAGRGVERQLGRASENRGPEL